MTILSSNEPNARFHIGKSIIYVLQARVEIIIQTIINPSTMFKSMMRESFVKECTIRKTELLQNQIFNSQVHSKAILVTQTLSWYAAIKFSFFMKIIDLGRQIVF